MAQRGAAPVHRFTLKKDSGGGRRYADIGISLLERYPRVIDHFVRQSKNPSDIPAEIIKSLKISE